MPTSRRRDLSDEEYRRLLEFRSGLRRFLRWSEEEARRSRLTAAQHQLLLAVRGHADPRGPTIADLAHSLLLRHHSVVGLVDRAEAGGLVERERHSDPADARLVRVQLTTEGRARLGQLAASHLDELERLVPRLHKLWQGLDPMPRNQPSPAPGPVRSG